MPYSYSSAQTTQNTRPGRQEEPYGSTDDTPPLAHIASSCCHSITQLGYYYYYYFSKLDLSIIIEKPQGKTQRAAGRQAYPKSKIRELPPKPIQVRARKQTNNKKGKLTRAPYLTWLLLNVDLGFT